MLEDIHIAVFHILVRKRNVDHIHLSTHIVYKGKHRLAKTAGTHIFLQGHDQGMILQGPKEHLLIDGLDEAGVDQAAAKAEITQ